jgi:thiosulfate dehydrogenase (quinone) large subunit
MDTTSRHTPPAATPADPVPAVPADAVTATIPAVSSNAFRYVAAALRMGLGWIFLWAFLDKLLALGFSTGKDARTGVVEAFGPAAWVNGGSPTKGFLAFATTGPLAGFYRSFAGAGWADLLFMLGLLGIGLALMLGVAPRIATASGVAMLVMMWSAALPPENNPVLDDHLIYAVTLVALLLCGSDKTLGLGQWWARLPLVSRHAALQ